MSSRWLHFLHRQVTPFLFLVLVLVATFPMLTYTSAAQNTTTATADDRVALLDIKSMIKDDPQGVLTSWNESNVNFCQWQGVTCSTRHQRVTLLDLSSRDLFGSLSPSIGNLTFLRVIWLQKNTFSGEIPPEIGSLFRLQNLRLQNNSFQGNIPAAISNCSNLQVLVLGNSNLVGKIPDEIGSLSMLNALVIHKSTFQGGIPHFIGNLTLLDTLLFGNCQLGGSIPDVFHRLSKLRRLAMHGNNLVGTIPPSLYNVSSLEQLIIDDNRLTGRLPTNIGLIQPLLRVLSFPDNRLTGPIPSSILSSPQLEALVVDRNNLSGNLVITSRDTCNIVILSLSSNSFITGEDDDMKFINELSICKRLGLLDLGNNEMSGSLPESLGNLSTSLYQLSVAWNSFSGGLPSSIGNLSGLTSLDLSSNQLTGTLPVTIGNLVNLRRLDFKNNSFLGNIPGSLGNLSQLLELDMSLNSFNGSIPSSLGSCKRLIRLNLYRNNLTEDIPRQLFELTSLSISLNLGSNQLSAELPVEVGNLKNLNEIILANNRLSGELPSTLGSCSSLQKLNVSNNLFRGSLPGSLESLRGLENLDVSHNNFTGGIPTYLEVIPLTNLNISFNGFEGEVSRKGVFSNASSVSVISNGMLCGGIPELQLPKCSSDKKKKVPSLEVILVISIVSVLLCVATGLFFLCYSRKGEVEDDPPEPTSEKSLIQVSYETLYKATDGFSTKNFIGEGKFSSVYRGCLDKDCMSIVAIKVLNLHCQGGSKSFISECEALRNTRHRNLIKVLTCCSAIDFQGNEFKAIVYELMPNGNLDQRLHSLQHEFPRLTLLQRVCIALDVAYALDYLHHHAGNTIVHCDLKPSNILLDDDMVAHVGDFEISKILQSEYKKRHHSSSAGVRGTVGYVAPEYGLGNRVSRSADMYSYGILLLEMITTKKPTDAMFGDGLSLHNYAKTSMSDGALGIVNPVLVNNENGKFKLRTNKGGIEETAGYMNNKTCLRLLLEIGVTCSMESPEYRMDTTSVIQELRLIKDAILGNSIVILSFV